jgi:sugar diacid utilization regulator
LDDSPAGGCAEEDLPALLRRLPSDALATTLEGTGCIVVPDPDGPGRLAEWERAAAESRLALGSPVEPAALADSRSLARLALRASEAGVLPAKGLIRAEDSLAELLLFDAGHLAEKIADRRLAPLEELTEKARTRMRETALAYVRHGGNSVAMADALSVHPQTARYRKARLRELLGEQLDDPDARFELEVALRARA